jgi:hypothetical protein
MVAATSVDTDEVVTGNVALSMLPGMMTNAGTWTALVLLVKETVMPPFEAGPVSRTVPVVPVPPRTRLGLKLKLAALGGGVTVSVVRTIPFNAALMVEISAAATADVLALKVALVFPPGITTAVGSRTVG